MSKRIFLLAVLVLAAVTNSVSATPLDGTATILDPGGSPISENPVTGDLDLALNSMSVDPFVFFGFNLGPQSIELLGPGTYTRTDGVGGATTATVGPGQLGGYFIIAWNNNLMGTFMVWDVTSSATGGLYTTVDSDGDGFPGHAFVSGPFPGVSLYYDFLIGDPPPGINVTINISGGTVQECSETGGSTVGLTAATNLVGGASLGRVDWVIDGASAGSGSTTSSYLALGSHSVDVTAFTTTGESGTDSITVIVRDTTPPVLEVGFLDQSGIKITSATSGTHLTAQISPTDVCDPAPVASGTAVPVFEIVDGDPIKLQSGKINTVELPTTAIELSATASDTSGNSTSGMAVLSITD